MTMPVQNADGSKMHVENEQRAMSRLVETVVTVITVISSIQKSQFNQVQTQEGSICPLHRALTSKTGSFAIDIGG